MIALPSQLPLLRVGEHDFVEYQGDWIAASIRSAAMRAGHPDWWIAEDIARGVVAFLEHRYPRAVITLEELEGKIRGILERIGFNDIAAAVRVEPPQFSLNLSDLAREAAGAELFFFQMLDRKISHLFALGVRRLAVGGTRAAVKYLRSAKNWSEACRLLEDEIVCFLRRRLSDDNRSACEWKLEAA
ncbi:MAG: hypothetical protein KA004_07570 [Verrucomicrobiales bacterium]|nr:hypothetical protein [Verrucomicrobiales bacterium]